MNHETEYSALLGLLAACNRHLEAPNTKLFAAAILEAEAIIGETKIPAPAMARKPASSDPANTTAITLRKYSGENLWPSKWVNPDALLAACVGGAKEGQLRKSLNAGQFAVRHSLARLQKEGWLKCGREHDGASRIWSPLTAAEGGVATLGSGSRTPLTVAALRELHATCEEESSYLDDWIKNAISPSFHQYSLAEIEEFVSSNLDDIMAGCSEIKRAGIDVFWLPEEISEDDEDEEMDTEEEEDEELMVDV